MVWISSETDRLSDHLSFYLNVANTTVYDLAMAKLIVGAMTNVMGHTTLSSYQSLWNLD